MSDTDSDSDVDQYVSKLENKMIVIPNPDKVDLDVDFVKGDSNIRFSLPFRACIAGQVSTGKTTMALNIILQRQLKEPRFDEIHIIHGLETSREYNSIEPTSIRTNIPHISDFCHNQRILLVFDDIEFTKLKRSDLRNLIQIVRTGSHCGMSMIFVNQIFCSVNTSIRDNCNVFVLYKPTDLDSINTIGRRVGLNKKKITHVFDNIITGWHDSLCINFTKGALYRYSKNLFEPIEIE